MGVQHPKMKVIPSTLEHGDMDEMCVMAAKEDLRGRCSMSIATPSNHCQLFHISGDTGLSSPVFQGVFRAISQLKVRQRCINIQGSDTTAHHHPAFRRHNFPSQSKHGLGWDVSCAVGIDPRGFFTPRNMDTHPSSSSSPSGIRQPVGGWRVYQAWCAHLQGRAASQSACSAPG